MNKDMQTLFDELLEAYKQIKQRKFKIRLVEDDQVDPNRQAAEQQANQWIGNAVAAQGNKVSTPAGIEVWVASTGKQAGNVVVQPLENFNFPVAIADGTGNPLEPQNNRKPYYKFVSTFMTAMGVDPTMDPNTPVGAVSQPKPLDSVFADIGRSYGRLANQAKAAGNKSPWVGRETFLKLQDKLEKSQMISMGPVEDPMDPLFGLQVGRLGPADDDTRKSVARSIKDFLEFVVEGPKSREDLDRIKGYVSTYRDKLVFTDPTDPTTGMVFTGSPILEPYRFAVDKFFDKYQQMFSDVSPASLSLSPVHKASTPNAQDIGFLAEGFELVVNRIQHNDKMGAIKALQGMVSSKEPALMRTLSEIGQVDVREIAFAQDSIEDYELYTAIRDNFGDRPYRNMLLAFARLARNTVTRNPMHITHKGGETGLLVKDDTVEIYSDAVAARLALQEQGFDDDSINRLVRPMANGTAEVGNAIKTYLRVHKVKTGELELGRMAKTIHNPDPEEASFVNQCFDALDRLRPGKPAELDELGNETSPATLPQTVDRGAVRRYSQRLEQVQTSLNTVFSAGSVTSPGGGTINGGALKTSLINNFARSLGTQMTYSQLKKSDLHAAVSNSEFDPDNVVGREKLKEALGRKLTFAMLSRDLSNPRRANHKAAKESIAMMIRTNAASVKGSMLDVREVVTGEQFLCDNNAVADIGLKGLLSGSWSVRVSPGGSTLAIVNPRDPRQELQLRGERQRTRPKSGDTVATTRMAVEVSRAMLKENSVLSDSTQSYLPRPQSVTDGIEALINMLDKPEVIAEFKKIVKTADN